MNITKARIAYLSGTGTTEKYARAFANALDIDCQVTPIRHDTHLSSPLEEDELLVLAGPVFGCYMPAYMWEWLDEVRGNRTPLVNIAVYGARDYDNALFEMDEKMSGKGFVTVGAAALVARHSIAQTVATNRPDDHDIKQVKEFARTISKRLEDMESINAAPVFRFKHNDKRLGTSVFPLTDASCTMCGTCATECLAGAIPLDAPNELDESACISCLRCIEVCPEHARHLPVELVERVTEMLHHEGATDNKPNEFF